ncbi:hypothetical protein PKF05_03170 [Fusobacterium simiae]|uniref:Holin n=1 Tax=Fusobacterium simiae TaxID=855 RepID=A0ABT4DFC0_FUSSI|nr:MULTISPECIES: hypothetical protein [Fusobacterium]MCY7007297.1 hypothetical protein [Fusobacterium simiae]MDC7954842.1 hypothetical protein [Fusobacterium simiae]
MRIRLSGDVGGMVIVIFSGLIAAAIIDFILSFIEKHFIKENQTGKKVISTLRTVNWIFFIALIILDLTSIFPLIRGIWFSILLK